MKRCNIFKKAIISDIKSHPFFSFLKYMLSIMRKTAMQGTKKELRNQGLLWFSITLSNAWYQTTHWCLDLPGSSKWKWKNGAI